ncbi:HNH endonuclease [Granulicella sp. S190]|uniref:HNH endonuclease n=1 Tax=Granulicella sp. S190 TaxID=1747226 RepID=UPI00131C2DC0|nr:HNH endonuclease [Granulicella sp. S190]
MTNIEGLVFSDSAAALVEQLVAELRSVAGESAVYSANKQIRAAVDGATDTHKGHGVFLMIAPRSKGAAVWMPSFVGYGDKRRALSSESYPRILVDMARSYAAVKTKLEQRERGAASKAKTSETHALLTNINHNHILEAIADLRRGVNHDFGRSMFYDLLYQGDRYPPKAVFGLAAGKAAGMSLGPQDLKGSLKTICFRTLRENGFEIVTKPNYQPFPEEVDLSEEYSEGAIFQVAVNRFERDLSARAKCIEHHGPRCQACGFDFEMTFGAIGKGFIHVHHLIQLSDIRSTYVVNPIDDLIPVCPNCHAILHKRSPPYSLFELRCLLQSVKDGANH